MGETVATGMQTEEFNTPSAFPYVRPSPGWALFTEEFRCVCFRRRLWIGIGRCHFVPVEISWPISCYWGGGMQRGLSDYSFHHVTLCIFHMPFYTHLSWFFHWPPGLMNTCSNLFISALHLSVLDHDEYCFSISSYGNFIYCYWYNLSLKEKNKYGGCFRTGSVVSIWAYGRTWQHSGEACIMGSLLLSVLISNVKPKGMICRWFMQRVRSEKCLQSIHQNTWRGVHLWHLPDDKKLSLCLIS
jgi:hypothetical protein